MCVCVCVCFQAIQKEVRAALQKDHDEALAAPEPTQDKLYAHILTGEVW